MLPFAALIAIVAIGQTFVIQQGGLDLSLPGAVTLGALLVSSLGSDPSIGLAARDRHRDRGRHRCSAC